MLKETLMGATVDWQMPNKAVPGLNSGQIGEAISHMVGLGILEEFPTLKKLNLETDKEGVFFDGMVLDKSGRARFRVGFIFSDDVDHFFGEYRFNTSRKIVEDRIRYLLSRREKLRADYKKLSRID